MTDLTLNFNPVSFVNVDPETDIHYGFGHGNMISGAALDDICTCGTDMVYDEYMSDLKDEFIETIKDFLDNNNLKDHNLDIETLFNDYIADIANDDYQNDYQKYRYEKEGYVIEYDNNTNDIVVLKSPYYALMGICSPCAPNGGYLDSDGSVPTYCLDESFYDEYNPIEYEYFEVKDYKDHE